MRTVLVLALCLAMGASPAVAQQPPAPPPAAAPEPSPAPEATPSPEQPPANESAPSAPKTDEGRVEVQTLAPIDADGVGPLNPPQGLGPDHWANSERAAIEQIMRLVPARTASPAAQDLARRVLLSAGATPAGSGLASLVSLRVDRLWAMGEPERAISLAHMSPERVDAPLAARVRAEVALLAGDNAAACAESAAALRDRRDAFGQKLAVFCRLLGPTRDLGLALEVLKEQETQDPAFFTLVTILQGKPAKLERVPQAGPLHLAMARAASLKPPPDMAASGHGGTLAALTRMTVIDAPVRAAAAERAEALGAIGAEDVARAYAAMEFAPDAIPGAAGRAERAYDTEARALLFAAVRAQTDTVARAVAIERMLHFARAKGGYAQAARLGATLIAAMSPAPALAAFAPEAARALIAAGRTEEAKPWLDLARTRPGGAPLALAVLARLAGIESGADQAGVQQWWMEITGREGAVARATIVFSALDALGASVEPRLWRQVLAGAQPAPAVALPPTPILVGLDQAGAAKRRGEAVLYVLAALGEAGPSAAHPVTLGTALQALKAVGLEADARRMAVEAALAAGL